MKFHQISSIVRSTKMIPGDGWLRSESSFATLVLTFEYLQLG